MKAKMKPKCFKVRYQELSAEISLSASQLFTQKNIEKVVDQLSRQGGNFSTLFKAMEDHNHQLSEEKIVEVIAYTLINPTPNPDTDRNNGIVRIEGLSIAEVSKEPASA